MSIKRSVFLVQRGILSKINKLQVFPTGKFPNDFIVVTEPEDATYNTLNDLIYRKITTIDPYELLLEAVQHIQIDRATYYPEEVKHFLRTLMTTPRKEEVCPSPELIADFGLEVATLIAQTKRLEMPDQLLLILRPIVEFGAWHCPWLARSGRMQAPTSLYSQFPEQHDFVKIGYEKFMTQLGHRSADWFFLTGTFAPKCSMEMKDLEFVMELQSRREAIVKEFEDMFVEDLTTDYINDRSKALIADFLRFLLCRNFAEFVAKYCNGYQWLDALARFIAPRPLHVTTPYWQDEGGRFGVNYPSITVDRRAHHKMFVISAIIDATVNELWGDDCHIQQWRHDTNCAHKGTYKSYGSDYYFDDCPICVKLVGDLEIAAQQAHEAREEIKRNQEKTKETLRERARQQADAERAEFEAMIVAFANRVADSADKFRAIGCSATDSLRAATQIHTRERLHLSPSNPTIVDRPTQIYASIGNPRYTTVELGEDFSPFDVSPFQVDIYSAAIDEDSDDLEEK